jgi:anaerobic selenocysteine-containing dehydrogenase
MVHTMCRMCSTRCGEEIHIKDGVMVKIRPDKNHSLNRGHLCGRAQLAKDMFYHPQRLLKPLKRNFRGNFEEISWQQALDEIAAKMLEIKKKNGARAMGFWKGESLGTMQQDGYVRRFAHAFGSPNFMTNDSNCYNAKDVACKLVNGFWHTDQNMNESNLIIFWASNPIVSHRHFMRGLADARKKGAKLVVVDTRHTPQALTADLAIQPLPGTDGALLWGLVRYLLETDGYDKKFVEQYGYGFEKFAQYASKFNPDKVKSETGVPAHQLKSLAEMISKNRPKVIIFPGTGLEHQENGVNDMRVLACLQAMVGALDVPGGWGWSEGIGEQTLPLYNELPLLEQKPIGRDRFPVPYDVFKECHSMTAIDSMLGKGDYSLHGLFITGANPIVTNPNSRKVEKAFSKLDLLVVNDLFMTATAQSAHYVLPAASFLERSELHFYSGYQRVGLSTKVFQVDGIMGEYAMWRELAQRLGFLDPYFPWADEEEVNRWILEPTGISLEDLKRSPQGIQYKKVRYHKYRDCPFPSLGGTGKIEFSSPYLKKLGLDEVPVYRTPYYRQMHNEFPLILQTGSRKSFLYHTRHQNIPRVNKMYPRAQLEMNIKTAAAQGLKDGELVKVVSENGQVKVHVKVLKEESIQTGVMELYHGWERERANNLTYDDRCDPISGFSLIKSVPVRLEKP